MDDDHLDGLADEGRVPVHQFHRLAVEIVADLTAVAEISFQGAGQPGTFLQIASTAAMESASRLVFLGLGSGNQPDTEQEQDQQACHQRSACATCHSSV